jgi:hypothetical protein
VYHAAVWPRASAQLKRRIVAVRTGFERCVPEFGKTALSTRDEAYAAMISDDAVVVIWVRSEIAAQQGEVGRIREWGTVDDRRAERPADRRHDNRSSTG